MDHLNFEVETLEPRAMLAGDVTATVVGSSLVLRGDHSGNEFVVASTDEAGTLLVTGVNGTTINGSSSLVVEGVTKNIRANLKNGDNAMLLKRETFTSFDMQGRVTIKAGNGNDVVGIFGVEVDGRTKVSLKGGDDYFQFSNGRTRGLIVRTGDGDDLANLHNSDHLGVFNIRTQSGNAIVKSGFNEFHTRANSIKSGDGDDLVDISNSQFNTSRAPRIDGESGNDGLYANFIFATGNRNQGFEYDLAIGEINDSIEAHRGTEIYNELFSHSDSGS